MKKLINCLLILLIMMVAPLNIVHAANQNDEQVDLPLNRLGQNTQQETQNNNVNLFQTSQIGDLGKQQRAVVNSRTGTLISTKEYQDNFV